MKKVFWLVLFLLLAVPLSGQVTVPNTFVAGTVASATQVNQNFQALAINSLNRASGGKITGTIEVEPGITIDGVDISEMFGAGGVLVSDQAEFISKSQPQLTLGSDPNNKIEFKVDGDGTLTLDGNGTGAGLVLDMPLTVNDGLICTGCVGPLQLLGTGVSPGPYGNTTTIPTFTVDDDGRITSVTNTPITFPAFNPAPGSILETAIIDGPLLARMASNDTIVGAWTFNQFVTMNGTTGPYMQHNAPDGRMLSQIHSASNIFRILPVDGAQIQLGGGSPAESIIIQKLGVNVHFTVAGANGSTTFSQNNGGGLLLEWRGDKAARFYGHVLPAADEAIDLGSPSNRFRTAHFALPNNTTPALVVVNKGGGGPDANNALGYIQGYSPNGHQIKQMGACTVTIAAGIILNVTGC